MAQTNTGPAARAVGGFLALAGAGIMAGMVWGPWITESGESVTGWDLHKAATGSEQWYIEHFFGTDFSPFFPGRTVLTGAGVIALFGLGVLLSRSGARGATRAMLLLGGLLALAVGVVDVISIALTGPGPEVLYIDWGLLGVSGGGIVGLLGLMMATTRPRKTPGTGGISGLEF